MARLPLLLRPSIVVRRLAIGKGVLGSSTLWKVVAVVVFSRSTLKKVFGRQPELLGRRTIGVGSVLTVATVAPMTRRQAKRRGVTKRSLTDDAYAELEAAQRAS